MRAAIAMLAVGILSLYVAGDWESIKPVLCGDEVTGLCLRNWLPSVLAALALLSVWMASQQVIEANRQGDASTRQSLRDMRKDLIDTIQRFYDYRERFMSQDGVLDRLTNNTRPEQWTLPHVLDLTTFLSAHADMPREVHPWWQSQTFNGEIKANYIEYYHAFLALVYGAQHLLFHWERHGEMPAKQLAEMPKLVADYHRTNGNHMVQLRRELEVVSQAIADLDAEVLANRRTRHARHLDYRWMGRMETWGYGLRKIFRRWTKRGPL